MTAPLQTISDQEEIFDLRFLILRFAPRRQTPSERADSITIESKSKIKNQKSKIPA
jgi:hypothetical protein